MGADMGAGVDPLMDDLDAVFARLARSSFRRRFRLGEQDRADCIVATATPLRGAGPAFPVIERISNGRSLVPVMPGEPSGIPGREMPTYAARFAGQPPRP